MRFRLSEGVYCCFAGGDPVLLDTCRDRYLAVSQEAAATLRMVLRGDEFDSAAIGPLADLVSAGCLRICEPGEIWRFEPTRQPLPVANFEPEPAKGSLVDTLLIVARIISCDLTLRRRGIGRLLKKPNPRGMRVWGRGRAKSQGSVISSYAAATLCLGRIDQCLRHSFALKQQLAWRGSDCTLVIGVISRPFRAHCWIQIGDRVVSDDIERVRPFTPMLAL